MLLINKIFKGLNGENLAEVVAWVFDEVIQVSVVNFNFVKCRAVPPYVVIPKTDKNIAECLKIADDRSQEFTTAAELLCFFGMVGSENKLHIASLIFVDENGEKETYTHRF